MITNMIIMKGMVRKLIHLPANIEVNNLNQNWKNTHLQQHTINWIPKWKIQVKWVN